LCRGGEIYCEVLSLVGLAVWRFSLLQVGISSRSLTQAQPQGSQDIGIVRGDEPVAVAGRLVCDKRFDFGHDLFRCRISPPRGLTVRGRPSSGVRSALRITPGRVGNFARGKGRSSSRLFRADGIIALYARSLSQGKIDLSASFVNLPWGSTG